MVELFFSGPRRYKNAATFLCFIIVLCLLFLDKKYVIFPIALVGLVVGCISKIEQPENKEDQKGDQALGKRKRDIDRH